MTTATARSSTLPRRMKSRNPSSIRALPSKLLALLVQNTRRGDSGGAASAVLRDLTASRGISAHLLHRHAKTANPRVAADYPEVAGVPKRCSKATANKINSLGVRRGLLDSVIRPPDSSCYLRCAPPRNSKIRNAINQRGRHFLERLRDSLLVAAAMC